MRDGGLDPGSPFLSPRGLGRPSQERRLVTRLAAMAGNEQALPDPRVAAAATAAASATAPRAPASGALLGGLFPSEGAARARARTRGRGACAPAGRGFQRSEAAGGPC
jgi:protein SFI1